MGTVEILESSLVVPAEDTPRETLSLSNIDLLMGHKHNYAIFLFKNSLGARDFFSVEVLKSALAKTLVLFYPVAGRHVVGNDGRDQIDCNGQGVPFLVARLERTADTIQFEPMSPEIRKLFIPDDEEPHSSSLLLMLQVTYLKCGSVVLGALAKHILIDGRSAAHIFDTWSRIARGELEKIVPPSFDNTPLCARSPPQISFEFPAYTTDPSKNEDNKKSCVLSLFKVSKEQIKHLKIRCSKGSKSNTTFLSTFCVVSALVWKCYCKALGLAPDTNSRLYFSVDIRNRINPPIPAYFGNGAIRMLATSEVSKITSSPIGDVAATVKAEIDRLTDDYIRSFIDYLKVMLDKKTSVMETTISESDLRVRPILGMPLSDLNFGWDPPQLFSWERTTENKVAYIMNDLVNDNGIKIVLSLDPSTMNQFKKVFYEELLFVDEQNNN
ncbi:HXXXD-type acyl-transferase family protein [Rhynchospora pubera]|uniref:HXXXD-type acyl-transferase family protein n=1 Tax=Rhynchospora pubera TaxID=906938 RepID=A0AAV8EHA3_9POAL|nr:HXXXD-type acyl-transferase family protein [Rhynchospora pubera]